MAGSGRVAAVWRHGALTYCTLAPHRSVMDEVNRQELLRRRLAATVKLLRETQSWQVAMHAPRWLSRLTCAH